MSYETNRSFMDKKNRKIDFEVDRDITAYDKGREVGYVQFCFDDFTNRPRLYAIDVKEAYRRAGIGVEMIRLAAEIHGRNFDRPTFQAQGGSGASSCSYYTQDGGALIQHCIGIGIINDIPTVDERYDDRDV